MGPHFIQVPGWNGHFVRFQKNSNFRWTKFLTNKSCNCYSLVYVIRSNQSVVKLWFAIARLFYPQLCYVMHTASSGQTLGILDNGEKKILFYIPQVLVVCWCISSQIEKFSTCWEVWDGKCQILHNPNLLTSFTSIVVSCKEVQQPALF
jgi:hypothetical protein